MALSDHLQTKLALLPDQPGCYIMKDEEGKILYVGKAKVLKNRVRSYFHGVHNNKTTKLVAKIRDFEYIVTGSEKEALLLEINLIKKHRPPFNIMFMDDKMYPYIELTHEDDFAVRIARKATNRKNTYFGPYPSASSAYEIVKLINQIFPIRKCRTLPGEACLYYHMHQCLAPCIQKVEPEKQKELRQNVADFLKGNCQPVLEELSSRMETAAENLQFERAGEIHETILSIRHIMEKQTIDFADQRNRDVFAWFEDKGYISFQGLILRDGKMLERALSISPIYEEAPDAFVSYLVQYYQKNTIPREILVPEGTPTEALESALQTKVLIPKRGEKKKLLDMALNNAREAHEQQFALVSRKERELEMACQKLSRLFGKEIHTVELFDNSHIQGAYNVSGLAAFTDGKPDKSKYRRYKLAGYRSDTDSMKEVISRRFAKAGEVPDLLLLDGGLAQIHAAREVLNELQTDVCLAGLVKDDHHSTRALLKENGEEAQLDRRESLFFLLTRMQDEVHRFAISYHRSLRSKGMTHSLLDDIPGIGPKRKKELLKSFGSVKKIKEASQEELEKTLGPKLAQSVFAHLHEQDE